MDYSENKLEGEIVINEKQCKDCGQRLPATRDYFGQYKNKRSSGEVVIGFRNSCRKCMAANTKRHAKENPEIINAKNKLRIGRAVAAGGEFTDAELVEVRQLLDDKCRFCNVPLKGEGHIDHLTPVSRGGSSFIRNITLSCERCNLAKTNKTLTEFVTWRKERGLTVRKIKLEYERPDAPMGRAGRRVLTASNSTRI